MGTTCLLSKTLGEILVVFVSMRGSRQCLKRTQNLFFLKLYMSLDNKFNLKLFRNSKILSFLYNLVLDWIYYCLIQ